MTQGEKRIEIAKKCGWTRVGIDEEYSGYVPNQGMPGLCRIPDYFNSLDAMYEAEKILSKYEQQNYAGWLEYGKDCYVQDFITNAGIFRISHKTAEQKAEAFGKTFDLWD
jgi:hypothetical protein